MEFEELLRQHKSVRSFGPRPITEGELSAILAAINIAPSAGNLQAYEVVCVQDGATKEVLARAALGQSFVADAPVVLVFLANPDLNSRKYGTRGARLYCVQDATIACAFAHLRVADLGLASVWVGAFDDDAVAAAIGAPEGLLPVAMLPIGHAAESPAARPRRGPTDLVSHERFGDRARR